MLICWRKMLPFSIPLLLVCSLHIYFRPFINESDVRRATVMCLHVDIMNHSLSHWINMFDYYCIFSTKRIPSLSHSLIHTHTLKLCHSNIYVCFTSHTLWRYRIHEFFRIFWDDWSGDFYGGCCLLSPLLPLYPIIAYHELFIWLVISFSHSSVITFTVHVLRGFFNERKSTATIEQTK